MTALGFMSCNGLPFCESWHVQLHSLQFQVGVQSEPMIGHNFVAVLEVVLDPAVPHNIFIRSPPTIHISHIHGETIGGNNCKKFDCVICFVGAECLSSSYQLPRPPQKDFRTIQDAGHLAVPTFNKGGRHTALNV